MQRARRDQVSVDWAPPERLCGALNSVGHCDYIIGWAVVSVRGRTDFLLAVKGAGLSMVRAVDGTFPGGTFSRGGEVGEAVETQHDEYELG